LDEVGYWSEVKLEIVRKYAKAYSTILATRPFIKAHLYVDAFAGAGAHISKDKDTGASIAGSPVNAMQITPPFSELHLIDLDGTRVSELRRIASGDARVRVYEGDCNEILLQDVFPRCQFADYRRALCLLDPYRLAVDWRVVQTAGRMKSVEIFYNFMIMDANMNVFLRDPGKVTPADAARMDAVWGDRSWRDTGWRKTQDLLGELDEKVSNDAIAEAFRRRLQEVAGFAYVPPPMPMRNSKGAVVYYLYFASPDKTGVKIATEIFDRYRNAGVV
jgi:three-Cys-motif partner protein